mmetsp:Transcript_36178/g.49644  ORF Transcript_36178/g.49644 Transcript_36178/m.49644 type:complete len:214 (+) Transcript_36178:435-1076(+)
MSLLLSTQLKVQFKRFFMSTIDPFFEILPLFKSIFIQTPPTSITTRTDEPQEVKGDERENSKIFTLLLFRTMVTLVHLEVIEISQCKENDIQNSSLMTEEQRTEGCFWKDLLLMKIQRCTIFDDQLSQQLLLGIMIEDFLLKGNTKSALLMMFVFYQISVLRGEWRDDVMDLVLKDRNLKGVHQKEDTRCLIGWKSAIMMPLQIVEIQIVLTI